MRRDERRSLFPAQRRLNVTQRLRFEDDSPASGPSQKRPRPGGGSPRSAGGAASPFSTPREAQWQWSGSVVHYRPAGYRVRSAAVAAFGFDGVLVREGTSEPLHAGAAAKLAVLQGLGMRVVVLTDLPGGEELRSLQTRIGRFAEDVARCPLEVFVAAGAAHNRKPDCALWDVMSAAGELGVDSAGSFLCGPGGQGAAAQRDRRFAENVGVRYCTAEETLAGAAAVQHAAAGAAAAAAPEPAAAPMGADHWDRLTNDEWDGAAKAWTQGGREVLVLVGSPAAGKSTLCRDKLLPHGYMHVNQDRLGSRAKCIAAVHSALSAGKRVVVDNTNPSEEVRAYYIAAARELGAGARCIWLDTPQGTCRLLNRVRASLSRGASPLLPDDAFERHAAAFQSPSMQEGWDEIRAVRFAPRFDSPAHQRTYEDQRLAAR